jgi:hypothetical protein
MKFNQFLKQHKIKGIDAAADLAVTAGMICLLRRENALPSIRLAQKIFEWSEGEVGLMDWVKEATHLVPPEKQGGTK